MEIQLSNFRMEYDDVGLGIPVLLIHGFPFNRTLWDPQVKAFTSAARVITPDLRGFGGSDPLRGAYTMDLLAQDCHELLNDLGVKGPVVIGGLSMGGYVAFAFYRLFPERVAGLLLAATRAGPDSPEAKAGRDRNVTLVMDDGAPAIAQAMLPKLLSPKSYTKRPLLVASVREMIETSSVEGIAGALQGMRDRPDSTPTLASIDKPTLILHGEDDQLIPPKEAHDMQAAIRGSSLKILPEAGHLVNLEQPELFNEAAVSFIESI